MSNITTPTALALQLADAYANACFEQGLNQRSEDPAPESAREKLAANLAQIDNHVTEINRLRNVIQAACSGGLDHMIERWKVLFPDEGVPGVRPTAEAKDAARYRWLRDLSVPPHNFYLSVPAEFHGVKYTPAEVDAYIDQARSA